LILPALDPDYALIAAILPGDRIFLMLPWLGHALLGTTDTDFVGDPAAVQPGPSDTDYLLAAANRVLRRPLTAGDVLGSFAGLRALAIEPGRSPSENTREYLFHEETKLRNFISICGGKLTTARALGEKLVDRVAARLGSTVAPARVSRTTPLPGGNTGPFERFVRNATDDAAQEFGVPARTAERIVRTYGSRWRQVLGPIRENPALAEPLAGNPPLLAAEVQFAIRDEMAANVDDFLVRRSGLNWLGAGSLREAAPAVAEIFARQLGWSPERRQDSLAAYARCCGMPRSS
jgi:glycerol-3-phosphate dehydrogenase